MPVTQRGLSQTLAGLPPAVGALPVGRNVPSVVDDTTKKDER